MRKNESANLVASIMSSGATRPARPKPRTTATARTGAGAAGKTGKPKAKPNPKTKSQVKAKPKSSPEGGPARAGATGDRKIRFCVRVRPETSDLLHAHILDVRMDSGRRPSAGAVVADALGSVGLADPELDEWAAGRGGDRVPLNFYLAADAARALLAATDQRKRDRMAARSISDIVDAALRMALGGRK